MRQASQNKIQSFAFVIVGFESTSGRCKIELDGRINPNDAPVESLVRLPGLGIGRAEAIVAYRERPGQKSGGGPAFQNGNDLQKVKGIGPTTVQNISEWLKFK
jgi:competence ComEA-like helix-hairpin-helix protein